MADEKTGEAGASATNTMPDGITASGTLEGKGWKFWVITSGHFASLLACGVGIWLTIMLMEPGKAVAMVIPLSIVFGWSMASIQTHGRVHDLTQQIKHRDAEMVRLTAERGKLQDKYIRHRSTSNPPLPPGGGGKKKPKKKDRS